MANTSSYDELPKERCWETRDLYNLQGFWYSKRMIKGVFGARSQFKARPDDIILASFPKTGTTWLKALSISILQTQNPNDNEDPLSLKNPHAIIRWLEYDLSRDEKTPPDFDLSTLPSPRIFHTHMAYIHLADTIKNEDTKIVYITRNPKDVIVSSWHFFNDASWRGDKEPYPLEKVVDEFCEGLQICGPYFDHVLGYWLESLKRPDKVLFLKYEDMKRDPKGEVKKLALFIGKEISDDEEMDKVLWRASIDRLKNEDVNKNGVALDQELPNRSFFRKGVLEELFY